MSNPHRGLPPLPPLSYHGSPGDNRPPHPPSQAITTTVTSPSYESQPLGQLPEAPRGSHGPDEAMRNWLSTKAEEERRKQEEERTKQEGLRLEQRKIEQTMLRDSLQAGIPAPMVPLVFAGMGGAEVAKVSVEWAQHYMSQMSIQQQQQQQQQQHINGPQALPAAQSDRPDTRGRSGSQSAQYTPQAGVALQPLVSFPVSNNLNHILPPSQQQQQQQPPPPPPSQPPPPSHQQPQQQQGTAFASPRQPPPPSASGRFHFQQQEPQAAGQRQQGGLSRLNTGGSLAEMQIQQPPPGGMQMPTQPHPSHRHSQGPTSTPQQQQQQQPSQGQSSPAIYFHHWTPPISNKDPATPGTKSTHSSPYGSYATSHLRHEYANTPKKRRTTGSGGVGFGRSSNSSIGNRDGENDTTTTSPQEADSPQSGILRHGEIVPDSSRKRGVSNATKAESDLSSLVGERQGSAGPLDRKRTLSGTPKADVDPN